MIPGGFQFQTLMAYWYYGIMVYWSSDSFLVLSGLRRGGVLSPKIVAVYMDNLVILLKKSGVGCYVVECFAAAILYADDVCLLAPTRSTLQKLLDICGSYADFWCIHYNSKKMTVMIFGRNCSSLMMTQWERYLFCK